MERAPHAPTHDSGCVMGESMRVWAASTGSVGYGWTECRVLGGLPTRKDKYLDISAQVCSDDGRLKAGTRSFWWSRVHNSPPRGGDSIGA